MNMLYLSICGAVVVGIVCYLIGFKKGFKYFYFSLTGKKIKVYFKFNDYLGGVMRYRNPDKVDPKKVIYKNFWNDLWLKAYTTFIKHDDPRSGLLERYRSDPERILRKLSIISDSDLKREFKDVD